MRQGQAGALTIAQQVLCGLTKLATQRLSLPAALTPLNASGADASGVEGGGGCAAHEHSGTHRGIQQGALASHASDPPILPGIHNAWAEPTVVKLGIAGTAIV